jgi:hypothetical protein
MKRYLLLVMTASALVLLAGTGTAAARWSAPESFPIAPYVSGPAVAVNARGDAAVAWATRSDPAAPPVRGGAVYVTVRLAHGRLITRRVWSSRRAGAGTPAVAIGRREVTVAWVTHTRRQSVTPGDTGTVRAAYGPLAGRWHRARVVGRGDDAPDLAAAPGGETRLVWVANGYTGRIAEASRRRGHGFGRPRRLRNLHAVGTGGASHGPRAAFDARGTGYVWAECDGVVRIARPHRSPTRSVVLATGPVLDLSLAVTDAGTGLAAWAAGPCSTDASATEQGGPAFGSALVRGRFGKATGLTGAAAPTSRTRVLAAPGGGGTIAWQEATTIFTAAVGTTGVFGPGQPITAGLAPLAADGGGDQVLAGEGSAESLPQFGVVVRRRDGGPDEPAPRDHGALAAATPLGRAFALAWNTSPTGAGGREAIAVWRP